MRNVTHFYLSIARTLPLIAAFAWNTGCDRVRPDQAAPSSEAVGTNTWAANLQIESLGLPTNSTAYLLACCLPESIDTVDRHIIVTENQARNGTSGAMVKANYMGVENGALEILLTDCGPEHDLSMQSGMDWINTLMERESTTEYSRAFRRGDTPVFETYNRNQRYGHLKALIEKRWLIEVTVFGLPANLLHKALLSIDTGRLGKIPPAVLTAPQHPSAPAMLTDLLTPAPRRSQVPAEHTPGSGRAGTAPGR